MATFKTTALQAQILQSLYVFEFEVITPLTLNRHLEFYTLSSACFLLDASLAYFSTYEMEETTSSGIPVHMYSIQASYPMRMHLSQSTSYYDLQLIF
jgi:hypothetical protein